MTIAITSITDDTGVSSTDNLTKDETFDLNGTWTDASGNPAAGITIYIYEGSTAIGTTTTNADGTWTLSGFAPVTLNGEHGYTAVSFAGGVQISGAPFVVTVDTTIDVNGSDVAGEQAQELIMERIMG